MLNTPGDIEAHRNPERSRTEMELEAVFRLLLKN